MKTAKDKELAEQESTSFSAIKEPNTKMLRSELAEMIRRHSFSLDENRTEAVAKCPKKNYTKN
ncbi:MAG: hypothetical protein APR62_14130 [Smithella sp. SDB]|nr:MAG: hypothetical protein APR62_14130 [Smithella sp. SDB]